MAQSLFKREEKHAKQSQKEEIRKAISREEKLEILKKLENSTKREAEKITVSLSSAPLAPVEKIRSVSTTNIEIKFTAKEELLIKLKSLEAFSLTKIQISLLLTLSMNFVI